MPMSSIVAFSGHMIDHAERTSPRFPATLEAVVRCEIYAALMQATPAVAITSAACGGDLLFAEAALQQQIPLIVVLPFQNHTDFLQQSVTYAGQHWVDLFEHVYEQATAVVYCRGGSYQSDRDFEVCQHTLITLGQKMAAARTTALQGLALCDHPQLGSRIGGTHSFVTQCQENNILCDMIDLAHLRNIQQPVSFSAVTAMPSLLSSSHRFVQIPA